MLPKDPLDYTSDWQCGTCGHQVDYVQVSKTVDSFNEKIKHLYENDRYNVDSWLSLVVEARPKFHKQHMVMIELAKWLVPILCRGPGMDLSQFPIDLVHLRLNLAISFLNVLDVVEPGLSKFRAKFMFEMIDTK